MNEINLIEGKLVAPQGMKVSIVASRFNEIIVNKLLGGAVDGLVRHGVEEKNIHAYRHTFGTNLCRQGVPIQTASKLLGHDDISTTAKYYVNVSDEEKARAIEKLAVNLAIPC